jgi:hypothetical protein
VVIDRDHHVIPAELEIRKTVIGAAMGRDPLQVPAQAIAELAGQPGLERRQVGALRQGGAKGEPGKGTPSMVVASPWATKRCTGSAAMKE